MQKAFEQGPPRGFARGPSLPAETRTSVCFDRSQKSVSYSASCIRGVGTTRIDGSGSPYQRRPPGLPGSKGPNGRRPSENEQRPYLRPDLWWRSHTPAAVNHCGKLSQHSDGPRGTAATIWKWVIAAVLALGCPLIAEHAC